MDLAGRYSKRSDLQKLETVLAKTAVSGIRRRKKPTKPPRRIERRLDAHEITELLDAYQGGESTRALSSRHGISKTSVLRLLDDHDVPLRYQRMTDPQVDRARRLYMDGHSLASISRMTSTPASTIRGALKARNIAMRPAGGSRPGRQPRATVAVGEPA